MSNAPASQLAARKQRAQNLFQRGQLKQARKLYEKLCRENRADAESHYMLASVCGQLGQFKEAAQSFQRCISLQPDAVVAHCGLGAALKEQGQFVEAERSFRQALRLQPDNADVLLALANALLSQSKLAEAEACLQLVLRNNHGSAEALHGLGEIRHANQQLVEAIDFYKRAIKIDPNRAATHNRLGHALYLRGELPEAVAHFKQALQINPRFVEAYKNLGAAFAVGGQLSEAATAYQTALKISPDYLPAVTGMMDLHQRQGEHQAAYDNLLPLIKQGLLSPELAYTFVNICHHLDCCAEAIDYAEQVLGRQDVPAVTGKQLQYALGKLYDRLGEYDKAFDYYQQANAHKQEAFDTVEHIAVIDALIQVFNWQFRATAPRATVRSDRPIFIVGMPRSGTSLTEQILASHPGIYGGGELPDIGNMIGSLPALLGPEPGYPYNLRNITTKVLDSLARRYLDHLNELDPSAVRVTDKMPQNYLFLGMIGLMFPDARIIHCVRDPRDTCLSIYFQNFSEGHAYANGLEHIGLYYRQYEKLMQHYQSTLDIPILEVRYEELVSRQEEMSRRLVDFAGLDWDDRCLQFHKSKRTVATASYEQVQRSMYSSSIERWKHYEKFLGPLFNALSR